MATADNAAAPAAIALPGRDPVAASSVSSLIMQRFASVLFVAALAAGSTAIVAADAPAVPATIDLESALALALENNYAIRQARAAYLATTGDVMASEAGKLPTLSATSGYTRLDENLVVVPGGDNTAWNAGIQARQVLYAGGAISSAIRGSRLERDAARDAFTEAVQSALLNVRVSYLAVLLAREQIGVQEQAVRLLEEELATAEARVNAGSGSPFDQLRAEVALANGQPPLIRARNAYHVAAVDLLLAIGLPADADVAERVVGELAYEPREIPLETALASARVNRAEVHRLEKLVEAAEAGVSRARAGGRPSVALFGGYSVEKSQFAAGSDSAQHGWTAGAQASWDIFDGRATKGRVLQARAFADQARLSLEDAKLAIEADVRRSHASFLNAVELVNASQRVVEQAEESLRLARSRFNAGAATQLDVLQAQVALTDARNNVAQALHDVTVAHAFLERSAALAPLPESAQLNP
jgi:outer membrane protein